MRSLALLLPSLALVSLVSACGGDIHDPAGPADGVDATSPSDLGGGDNTAPDPGAGDPGGNDPGTGDPGTNDPGPNDPGTNDPGPNDPGPGDSGPGDVPADAGPDADTTITPPPGNWDPYCTEVLFPDYPIETQDPNCYQQDALFTCAPNAGVSSSPARVRRISRNEMVRAGGVSLNSNLGQNPFEPPDQLFYPTYDEGVSVDVVTLDLYMNIVTLPGAGFTHPTSPRISYTYLYGGGGGPPVDACIFDDASPDQACRDTWLDQFLPNGLLFRPPTAEERAYFAQVLDDALTAESTNGMTRQETLGFVTAAAWLSPEALFREEFGDDTADANGRHRLTDAELGKQLAYLIGDRGPGAAATHTSTGGWHIGWSNAIQGDRVPYLTDVRAAVADGSIQDPAVMEQLIRDNFGGENPERPDLWVEFGVSKTERRGAWWLPTKVRDFFREWLGYLPVSSAFKDTPIATTRFTADGFDVNLWDNLVSPPWSTAATGGYVGNLSNSAGDDEATLVQQMDDFIARVVQGDSDVFSELMTSRLYRVPSSKPGASCTSSAECSSQCLNGRCYSSTWVGHRYAALVYDIPGHIEGDIDPANDPRWIAMPDGDRSGVLTHPAWLAAHGDNFEDGQSAILRGRWIREKLFCQHVPPLTKVPAGVEIMLPDSDPNLSARARILTATDNGFCGQCHQRMNDLGFPFEQYNHAGYLRGWDHHPDPGIAQGPVDASTTIDASGTFGAVPDPTIAGQTFQNAPQFLAAVANSGVAKRCFIRQAFRFFVGRDESLADACTLDQMEAAYDQKGSFIDMLVALATSDTMLYRTRPAAGEVCQ